MTMWNDVELLTNEDTNTVRLGSVSREDNCSGLYQVDTLVRIATDQQVKRFYSPTFLSQSIMQRCSLDFFRS